MGNWIHAIIRALDARGFAGADLALAAGISPRTIRNPQERAPQPAVTALWRKAVEVTGDPCFGLQVPRHVTVSTFGALAYAVFASRDLRSGLGRVVRYQKMISNAVDVRLEEHADRYGFAIDVVSDDGPPHEAIDAFFAVTARIARGLTGGQRKVEPLRVCLRRSEPTPSDLYRRVFRAPVEFGAPRDVLEYAKHDFELPLPDADPALAQRTDELLTAEVAALERGTLTDRVRAVLLETMPDGPTEQSVARRLCMSTSTLQAGLAREATTYKTLLNATRDALARRHLTEGRYTIKEIAFLLGFADAATFSRAFKRWTGASPARFAPGTEPGDV